MTEKNSALSLLDTRATATYLGCSTALLELMRSEGGGPKFSKCGKRLIRYRQADVDAWVEANARRKTADDIATNQQS